IDREIDQVINNCNAVSEHMHLKRASIYRIEDYFCDANLMRPWLDDMIGKSNEILNALLRLRKHQIAAEQARLHRITTSTSKRPGFQGRCHSCNISETPEWRRGPNGARTLCNACGLHYAKLNRKKSRHQQEQQNSSSNNNYAIKTETVHMMDEDDRTMR
ncbi:hypothetical protein BDF20DRAFT_823510, partial [Mycotypha africana]|uniref:uncharacterized protein n=1 Tax=Mycotypha africana TaxID=64632 RepID=UPI002301B9A4